MASHPSSLWSMKLFTSGNILLYAWLTGKPVPVTLLACGAGLVALRSVWRRADNVDGLLHTVPRYLLWRCFHDGVSVYWYHLCGEWFAHQNTSNVINSACWHVATWSLHMAKWVDVFTLTSLATFAAIGALCHRYVNMHQASMLHILQAFQRAGGRLEYSGPAMWTIADIESVAPRQTVALRHEVPSSDVCSVCQDSITKESIWRTLPCGHFFHAGCLDEWLLRQHVCPMCREPVPIARILPVPEPRVRMVLG